MQDQWPQVLGPCLLLHLFPPFNHLKGGHVSEGVPSDIDLPEGALHGNVQIPPRHANSDVFPYLPSIGAEYNPGVMEQDKLFTHTGLDDCDTLFKARHGILQ